MDKQYYLVELYEEYDRNVICTDKFITLNPEKYKKDKKNWEYKIEKIKIK